PAGRGRGRRAGRRRRDHPPVRREKAARRRRRPRLHPEGLRGEPDHGRDRRAGRREVARGRHRLARKRDNGPMNDLNGDRSAWLRCYRCWSQNLEIQIHYDAIRRIDPESGVPAEGIDEVQESVVQCLDCMHDQPHLTFQGDRVVPIEDRWERMVSGTPWVASCTVTVDQDRVESCSGPEAIEFLTYGAFGDAGVREFFTHVRFHKHDGERIVVHMLVELYARSAEEASEVLEEAAEGPLEITSLGGRARPPG